MENLTKTWDKETLAVIEAFRNKGCHAACKLISGMNPIPEDVRMWVDEFSDSGINESRITITDALVKGYQGNGYYTYDEEDYEERFVEYPLTNSLKK